jgi:hypothetical protein
MTELGGVGTGPFDASRFEMAIIYCVSVALAVGTLGYLPFVLGISNLILHCCRYSMRNMSLLFCAGLSSTKNMDNGSLVRFCIMFQILTTWCPSFCVSMCFSARALMMALQESVVVGCTLNWLLARALVSY